MIRLKSVYSHGSLSQVTRANFVESELAVAVIAIDPAWGFQEGIETTQLIGIETTQLICVGYAIHSIATNYEERKSIMRYAFGTLKIYMVVSRGCAMA